VSVAIHQGGVPTSGGRPGVRGHRTSEHPHKRVILHSCWHALEWRLGEAQRSASAWCTNLPSEANSRFVRRQATASILCVQPQPPPETCRAPTGRLLVQGTTTAFILDLMTVAGCHPMFFNVHI
jgi:hypothetical protein